MQLSVELYNDIYLLRCCSIESIDLLDAYRDILVVLLRFTSKFKAILSKGAEFIGEGDIYKALFVLYTLHTFCETH
jgi:hypothetical protein